MHISKEQASNETKAKAAAIDTNNNTIDNTKPFVDVSRFENESADDEDVGDEPELFLFNESFDVNLFRLKQTSNHHHHRHHFSNSIHQLNSTYEANNSSNNFDLINDLNKLYYKNSDVRHETTESGTHPLSHLDDVTGTNYFYENDLNLLKLNSCMNMDMDVNNLEQSDANTTSFFIEHQMHVNFSDATVREVDLAEDEAYKLRYAKTILFFYQV